MSDSGYSHVSFNKDLPQSSLLLHSPIIRSLSDFKHAPRTLFDKMGPSDGLADRSEPGARCVDVDWQSLVRRLQEENANLVRSLHASEADLRRCRMEKAELETIYAKQAESSDAILARLRNALGRQIQEKKEARAKQRELEAQLRQSELDRQLLRSLQQQPFSHVPTEDNNSHYNNHYTSRRQLRTLQSELDQAAAKRSHRSTSIQTTQDQVDQLKVQAEADKMTHLLGNQLTERRSTNSADMWQQALWEAQQQCQRETQMRMDLSELAQGIEEELDAHLLF
ncbi:hypothetical protein EC973_007868 [Apophysomyces ossiformis]|uniref:Uncharacterized protein n=1 Tax=Apophysomyces ossiformis TaxID=679940 RepID=A0A8H7BRG2_9FUNG|nr:hypothetical protein EC973_007868 [Apophysomyces ossiformis]